MKNSGATIWARKTIESDVFYWKPDKWFKIWFYIINRVNFEDTKLFPRGECFITYEQICEGTEATKHQVHEFIRWSKKERMLTTRKTTRGMVLKVLNYAKYQDFDTYKNHTKNQTETTRKPHGNHTISNKGNNEKNGKKDTLAEARTPFEIWGDFSSYWKKRVYKLYGLKYETIGGDKKAFFAAFYKRYNQDYKKLTNVVEFYLTSKKAQDAEVQTIRAALSEHSLMAFEKYGKGINDKLWEI
ncbi:hypothetical protein LCGC14_1482870 [marine sediment metagenome]|uniref:Uncharacterized protein n=1 Tax=marine sediment metagenome TaxID=412755 RepID=A0A0F9MAW9_9ZZZZ